VKEETDWPIEFKSKSFN